MNTANPFSVSYLTESALTPDDLLARYSFLPFRHIGDQVARPTNVFLIGRKGVGKTMLLKMFDPDVMIRLFSHPPREKGILRLIPPAALGVYFNLGAAAARVNVFQGGDQTTEWWQRAYADYLNTVLLNQALHAIAQLVASPKWSSASGVDSDHVTRAAQISERLLPLLRAESSQFEGLRTLEDLRQHLQTRAQAWARFVNRDRQTPEPPDSFVPFGVPLFALVRAVREAALFKEPFRLWVLVDQYEYLYQHRRKIDFRPVFNGAIYQASRGGTGVEFKIGTRQYAYREFKIAHSDVQIEINREIVEVDVDRLSTDFYPKFALDVLRKRLLAAAGRGTTANAVRPTFLLPAFEPRDEAMRYVSVDSLDKTKHLKPFLRRWQRLGCSEVETISALEREVVRAANPLVSTLACVALTRWIRDGAKGVPLRCGPPLEHSDRQLGVGEYLERLVRAIDQRYTLSTADARKSRELRAVDDFVHDAEESALFQIASAYKNQRKYYAGIRTIIKLSSNVALVLIEMLREAYEYLALEGGDPLSEPIPPELQSAAVYHVSETLFGQIPHECDFGETYHSMLSQLGGSLRELQLELTVPQPSANGFSLESVALPSSEIDGLNRSDARTLISEAVSWGLLEESDHQSKAHGASKRHKYYLNRAFCPYFGLSEIRKKDPIYVDDVEAFVAALLRREVPETIRETLRRARGLAAHGSNTLFESA